MKRKKSQIQLGENVVILVIFFFLLVIAAIFYSRIQGQKTATKQEELYRADVINLKTLTSAMPELACSENKDITPNCIDMVNLEQLEEYWRGIKDNDSSDIREYYVYRFGAANINISMLDMYSGEWKNSWTLYTTDVSNSNVIKSDPIIIPVSLYNVTSNNYEFGIIEMEVFKLRYNATG